MFNRNNHGIAKHKTDVIYKVHSSAFFVIKSNFQCVIHTHEPAIHKNRIIPFIFKYALILQSDSQNGVVIKTYIARLISLPASCVFYGYAPSLLEDKYVITRALVEIRKL